MTHAIDINGRYVRVHEWGPKYNPHYDAETIRMFVLHQGRETFTVIPVKPGKSLREARERAKQALQTAVSQGRYGEVTA